MTKTSRISMIRLLLLGGLVLAAPAWSQNRSSVSEQVAKAYGLDAFSQIEQIRHTFNIPERNLFANVDLRAQDRSGVL